MNSRLDRVFTTALTPWDWNRPGEGNKVLFNDEAVALLDQLDEHLAEGGTLNNFVPTSQVTAVKETSIEPATVD